MGNHLSNEVINGLYYNDLTNIGELCFIKKNNMIC